MTFLINQAIFILINVLMARKDNAKIKNHIKVDHLLNGVAYTLAIVCCALVFEMPLAYAGLFTVCAFCNRQLTFDIPLNLMRKFKWNYVSPEPTSWVDKREIQIFGQDGTTPNIVYALVFTVTLIIGSNI